MKEPGPSSASLLNLGKGLFADLDSRKRESLVAALRARAPERPPRIEGDAANPAPQFLKEGILSAEQYVELLELLEREGAVAGELGPTRIGRWIGRYRIKREIAQGGMGHVFEAEDPELRRSVAVKVLKVDDPQAVARLHREAAIAAQLRHPNIVGIHEVGTARDEAGGTIHFIVMDFVEGATLAHLLAGRERKPRELLPMIETVARAAGFAHEQGVVHRDLKPANVLVEDRRVLLTDFGLARAARFESRLTASHSVLGTPQYMAPEQVEGRTEAVDARADVYALGVMLFEILTGRLPFVEDSAAKLFKRVLQEDPPRPRSIRGEIEADFEVICLKALEKDPARRYANGTAFANDLRRAINGEAIQAKPASWFYRARKRLARRRPLVITAGIAALAAAGIATFLAADYTRSRSFRSGRDRARAAHAERNWNQALAESEQALAIRSDAELATIAAECRKEIERRTRRETHYRWLQERKLQPLGARIFIAAVCFYDPKIDIQAKVAELEQVLSELEALARDEDNVDCPDLWALLGIGWYVAGFQERSEECLLKAEALAPQDGRVCHYLGKICVYRLLAVSADATGATMVEQLMDYRERRTEASKLAERALRYFERSRDGWGDGRAIDLHLAKLYQAVARVDRKEIPRIIDEGLREFPKEQGAEEYWLIGAWLTNADSASVACGRAIERMAHCASAYNRRAGLRETKDPRGAVSDYDAALRINRRLPSAYIRRGMLRLKAGEVQEATADFTAAIGLTPNNPAAYHNRANALREQGKYDDAIRDYDVAVRLMSEIRDSYEAQGKAREDEKDHDAAVRNLEVAKRMDEALSFARLSRGVLRATRGDLPGALKDCEETVRLKPQWALPYLTRALLRDRRTDFDGAFEDYDRAIRACPASENAATAYVRGFAHYCRGRLRSRQGRDPSLDLAEAVRCLPSLQYAPGCRVDGGSTANPDSAITLFDSTIRALPFLGFPHAARGWAHAAKGDWAAALRDFDEAVRLDPDDPEAYLGRGQARWKTGDAKGASEDISEALRRAPPDWPWRKAADELRRAMESP